MPFNNDQYFDFRHDHRTCRKPSKELESFEECTGYQLPLYKIVCPTCNGTGRHVNPSIDGNGLTSSDFAEDPDFAESYFSGAYDVTCYECGGNNVVDDIDYERANIECPEALREWEQWLESGYESDAIAAAERRFGC